MKPTRWLSLALAASLILLVSPGSYADRNPGKALRGIRNAVRSGARRPPTPFSRGILSQQMRGHNSNPLRSLSDLSISHGDFRSPFHSGRRAYRQEDSMAKAYRDVGIANAMVGLVGVLATLSQEPVYAPVCAPAPAPAAVPLAAPAAPSGYWERRPVAVHPEHYEQYQVWIPAIVDARTGATTGGGYYETRSRLVPEQIEYQDVWVSY